MHLEHQSRTLRLLVTTQLEVLASLQGQLQLGLALDALQPQDDLLGGLGLLVEDGLGLTTITALLPVITSLTLGEQGGLASLVLGDLVLGVLAALLALAVGVTGLGNVDLIRRKENVSHLMVAGCSSWWVRVEVVVCPAHGSLCRYINFPAPSSKTIRTFSQWRN